LSDKIKNDSLDFVLGREGRKNTTGFMKAFSSRPVGAAALAAAGNTNRDNIRRTASLSVSLSCHSSLLST
jgi:hypothetical protein